MNYLEHSEEARCAAFPGDSGSRFGFCEQANQALHSVGVRELLPNTPGKNKTLSEFIAWVPQEIL